MSTEDPYVSLPVSLWRDQDHDPLEDDPMRTLLALLLLAAMPTLASDGPKKYRYGCTFPDKSKDVVDAPDDASADGQCRELWKKKKPKGWKGIGGVEDDLFSRRSLER